MTMVAVCSVNGAPGVSTTALALTWVWPEVLEGRQVLLVDADPAGSGVREACPVHVAPGDGVLSLAAEPGVPDVSSVLGHAVGLDRDGRRFVLPGVNLPTQARAVAPVWPSLGVVAGDLHVLGMDVVVDVGRLGQVDAATGLVAEADVVLVVMEPTARSTVAMAATVRELTAARAPRLGPVVLVRPTGPYAPAEVADALDGARVWTFADDPRTAGALLDHGPARVDRALLWRAARSLGADVVALLPTGVAW